MNALTEEAVLPTLHNLILAEVYLSGGPVDVFRLWSEMYERQKTIDVGTLLFVRAIAHLEEKGFLQKVSESKSALTEQGRAYLIALLLAGSLSDEALDRLAESGLKLASTGNILDVPPQQEEHPTKAVTYADGTGVVANRKPSIHTNSDTHLIRQNSIAYRGVAVSPAAPQILDRHGDDRFADNILRALEGLPQNGDAEEEEAAAEEGAAIEASGYQFPEFESNGRY